MVQKQTYLHDPRVKEVRCINGPQLEAPATRLGLDGMLVSLTICHSLESCPEPGVDMSDVGWSSRMELNHNDAILRYEMASNSCLTDDRAVIQRFVSGIYASPLDEWHCQGEDVNFDNEKVCHTTHLDV